MGLIAECDTENRFGSALRAVISVLRPDAEEGTPEKEIGAWLTGHSGENIEVIMSLEHRSGTTFHNIPAKRQAEYNTWLRTMAQLSPVAEADIREALNRYISEWLINNSGIPTAAFCSSWIPGYDWTEESAGVYQPIYLAMMHLYNDDGIAHPRAGWFFGLLLMDLMIHRADDWECWHEAHEPENSPEGLYYRPCRKAQQQNSEAQSS